MKYRQINILIGSACNMKCGYCLQTNEKSPADHKADCLVLAHKLADYLGGDRPRKISYWGGEPMLYWEKIRTIHSVLSERKLIPEDKSIITTNGRAMTDEYVEYANAHPDIWTVVSTHGWGFTEEQTDRFFRLNAFSLSSLIHHHHLDLWQEREKYWELKEKYGRRPNICAHFLRANDGCSPEYYMTREDADKFCRHIRNEVIPMARLGDEWARWQCSQLLYERDRVINKGEGCMCVRPDQLSVDTHGNIYHCHHNYDANNIVGNIFKKVIPIVSVPRHDPERFYKTQECQSCEILEQCRGGCYTSNTHEIDCYFAKQRAKLYTLMERILR